jgi:integrase
MNNQLICRKFIVLRDSQKHIVAWTDFHKYIRTGKKKTVHKITEDGNKRFEFVKKFLNYVFFDKYNIVKLTNTKIEMVKEFLNDYGKGILPDDEGAIRNESTVNICVRTILDFLECVYETNKKSCSFVPDDIYKTVEVRNKRGKLIKKKIPTFEVYYIPNDDEIFRDIPESVFSIIFEHIMSKHKDILMLVALSAFAGLRPSESCNVRRNNSALGKGILFEIVDEEVIDVIIDLKKELNLRSDLKRVGSIKKERIQRVYPAFINAFYECYKVYLEYIEGKKYEADYGALSVNMQGKAVTYANYYGKFTKIVAEIIPILLSSDQAEVINYGHLLQEHNISPHVFRHWFSVQLTLFGEDLSGLMYWRGDTSSESALTYLQEKSDLEKQYRKVNNEMFGYQLWKANKIYGDNK